MTRFRILSLLTLFVLLGACSTKSGIDGSEIEKQNPSISTDDDNDGLTNEFELATACLDSTNADTDGDGLSDGDEWNADPRTNPCVADTDGDGVADNEDSDPLIAERSVHVETSAADWTRNVTWRGNKLSGVADSSFDVISVDLFRLYAAPAYDDTSWPTPDKCADPSTLGLHDSTRPPCYLVNHKGPIILRGHVSRPDAEDTLVRVVVNAQFLFGFAQQLPPDRPNFCGAAELAALVFLNGQLLCSSNGGLGTFTDLASSGSTEDLLASPPIYGEQSVLWADVSGVRGWGISVDLYYRHAVSVTLEDLQ
ncbi:MAG: hypothetical protein V1798_03215 [Pseudomonadota bacterium]